MKDILVSSIGGLLLGLFFFGGLAWTIQKGLSAKRPALMFFLSFLVRFGAVVGGFFFITAGHPERVIGFVIGFIVARPIVTRSGICI